MANSAKGTLNTVSKNSVSVEASHVNIVTNTHFINERKNVSNRSNRTLACGFLVFSAEIAFRTGFSIRFT